MARQGQESVTVNMGERNNATNANGDKKKSDTLFGPNIGIVTSGPAWTETQEKGAKDELTPEIVKGWIAKSKEASQPTTTLQALVNLKRPTLRLMPFKVSDADDPEHIDSQHHHGLEFEYDCDAPKCGIYVHVVLSPDHRLADKSQSFTRVSVFESITEGGFGKYLKLEEGAILELGRFEHSPHVITDEPTGDAAPSGAASNATPPLADSSTHVATPAESDPTPRVGRKRFTVLNFRKDRRTQGRAVAGPALAVVDAEAHTSAAVPADKEGPKSETNDFDKEGVKAMIKLVALDDDGKEMEAANEQVTYLHIVRFGSPPVAIDGAPAEEDKRPWVVKVVKREATIGPHTFHLHEIYGLSSHSTASSQAPPPPPPPVSPTHTYPPVAVPPVTHEDEPSSECLVCLSSPREVVLLPCRHLVACKECALNMVEFGAGGNIVHNDAPEPAAPGEGSGDATGQNEGAAEGEGPSPSAIAVPPPPIPSRRKRKAKGWFCPVCRQPYTSLLRITTSPPAGKDVEKRDSTSTDDEAGEAPPPLDVNGSDPTDAPASRGPLGSIGRPGFLRNMSFRTGHGNNSPSLPPDLERGQVPPILQPTLHMPSVQ
ncbi:hypothetical protein JAAARDRAFT_34241 [Jaapia argillacea MUCL 33604]|uniref:RING-type domain-containing protein n=1 Tax=Jaapia argillacea MUCL 33604 TaxID=933084 RepID=A0A067Q4P0_9AGAM|nr:hypothetical protein JAAARDRAFT_34241 [Jaapia argillacea MUCL 33604]